MTREEAIQHLEAARKYPITYSEQEQEAYEMAFAALRAQPAKLDRSWWERCKFCKTKIRVRIIDITKNLRLELPCWFCPACGRPLTDEAWAELERRIGGTYETD